MMISPTTMFNNTYPLAKLFCVSLCWAILSFFFCSGISWAQQGNPEVFVDMSVLQEMGRDTSAPQQPIQLKPPQAAPQRQLTQPQLIRPAPAATSSPAITALPSESQDRPPSPAPRQPSPVISKAVPLPEGNKPMPRPQPLPIAVIQKIENTPPVKPQTKPAVPKVVSAEEPSPQIFPVETTTRTESPNPSASSMSRPVPVRSGIAGNLNDTSLSRPAPDYDPGLPAADKPQTPVIRDVTEPSETARLSSSKAVDEKVPSPPVTPAQKPVTPVMSSPEEARFVAAPAQSAELTNDDKKSSEGLPLIPPVIPPKRPDIQKVSPDIIAGLIEREQRKIKDKGQAIDLNNPQAPPGPKGKKNMPAVAKPAVESEPLNEQIVKLPAMNDPLLGNLVEKDKQDLVSEIEAMVAAREAGAPTPEKQRPQREQGTNIVKAQPMERPYNVYRPEKAEKSPAAHQKLASIAPDQARVTAPRPPQPRPEDEEAYVSVPFDQGSVAVNEAVSAELETKLLPLLNENPGWQLQIQAFASPIKDGLSSARKASLDRALAVRDYLLSKGVEASRIDMRALGAESDRDPMDRVDLILFDPAKKG